MHPIPDPWVAVVLVLAGYRATRFFGWDDWPPIYKLRAWVIGERYVAALPLGGFLEHGAYIDAHGETQFGTPPWAQTTEPPLPGKIPDSEVADVRPAYDRPLLAHLVHCPFCLGWWVSLTEYVAWLTLGHWILYLAAPFALSGAVGLIAKNLDP